MKAGTVKRLTREQMVEIVDNLLTPQVRGFTSEQIDEQLITFCMNCPNSLAAMRMLLDADEHVTPDQLVDQALACPPRDIEDVPRSELLPSHPLRVLKLEPRSQ